jgi:hypothetical protein
MDAVQFQQKAKEDAALRAFLEEVAGNAAEGAGAEVEEPQRYVTVTGVDFLFTTAAYVLFRWLKDELDNRRARRELDLAKEQQRFIAEIAHDLPPKEALAVFNALLKAIAKRTENDPALKAARAFLGTSKKG